MEKNRLRSSKLPPRKYRPKWVEKAVVERQNKLCKCGCGAPVGKGHPTHYDHNPALGLRELNRETGIYTPDENDPEYIDALNPNCHHSKTHGDGATTAGTDIGKMKKLDHIATGKMIVRKRELGEPKPRSRWGKRKMR